MPNSRPPAGPLRSVTIGAAHEFGLVELRSRSGLAMHLLPNGAVHAIRHGPILINQLLPGPAEDGLLRLWLRRREGDAWSGGPVVGPTAAWEPLAPTQARWRSEPVPGLACDAVLDVHPDEAAWRWRIHVTNTNRAAVTIDAVLAQDLGLGDEGGVRNNEAYTSQYLDLLPLQDPASGWVVLARQNQPAGNGHHPWLGLACPGGAAAYATDAVQVFGADHRLTGRPRALTHGLPSARLQGEAATAALQSQPRHLEPGATTEIEFVARFLPDHPAASGPDDLPALRLTTWPAPTEAAPAAPATTPVGLFVTAPWVHGEVPTELELGAWFPKPRRHVETGPAGELWSFFNADGTHVVTRSKEAEVARPHGHILRSGESLWLEPDHLGVTVYAAGQFGSQVYLGNTNLGRLLSVSRDPLNRVRAGGRRIFVELDGAWRQLGVPSVFELRPDEVRWWYRLPGDRLIVVRLWCARALPACVLRLEVRSGAPLAFLLTHEVVLGTNEFEQAAEMTSVPEAGALILRPVSGTPLREAVPAAAFAIAGWNGGELGGDGPLYPDDRDRRGPYVTLRTGLVRSAGALIVGQIGSDAELLDRVAQVRAALATGHGAAAAPAQPPRAPVRVPAPAAAARLDAVLPWFTHNAWIHFSAPHGLEQSGGAAWGVRDVCQGSIEWLLTAGEWATARRVLLTVFARQFPDGSWPQWFMHDPFRRIQAHHSHGDVCFWPLKALCDYLEATADESVLHERCRYAAVESGAPTDADETLLEHADRVLLHVATRFVPGTALVNYGDGDWDDTLQPANPAMRTRMISGWTVALAYHTFRQFVRVCERRGDGLRVGRLRPLLQQMRADFAQHLMPDGVAAGFLVREYTGERVLLHPRDRVTGIRYRLLPMTRAILAELFTPEEAQRHLALVREHLLFPDGARLMSEPARYHGGLERWFKRGDTAANVGREIGLQYVHAHLRYAEALARVGDAAGLWQALQVINPVGLREILAHAAPRQSNVYFSSSDADFPDRLVAAERWSELRDGRVAVRGGWRLYSSGPGLFLHAVRGSLLGVRECFDDVVFDPVLPSGWNGAIAQVQVEGRVLEVQFRMPAEGGGPVRAIRLGGEPLSTARRESNPYRTGGVLVSRRLLRERLAQGATRMEIEL